MTQKVLVIGGTGRIGSHVAQDLVNHTSAEVILTGRQASVEIPSSLANTPQVRYFSLNLDETEKLNEAIANCDLVIHCAGPFHYRDGRVLESCIQHHVNYIDVSDHRSFLMKVIHHREAAKEAGITAILNTGIFPGISNSMVKQGMEQLESAETIHLSYVVSGSGGAGVTVMRTTFLGLKKRFEAWIDGKWEEVSPYSDRETVEFPKPYGKAGVYWFDMPETYTFAESFPVKTIITKFGSVPDFYNHLTWIAAHVFPSSWLRNSAGIEFLAHVSHRMTAVTDKVSGIGVAIRSEIHGQKNGEPARLCSTLVHENTAISAGAGTGSVAELLLAGELNAPGIHPVEQVLPTSLFEKVMQSRQIEIQHQWL